MTSYAVMAKNYLEKLSVVDIQIEENLREQERLRTLAQGCKAVVITERIQSSPTGDSMERAIIQLTEKQEECGRIIDAWLKKSDEMIALAKKLEEPQYELILMLKYRSHKRLVEIAEVMGYSEVQIKRKHVNALHEFGKLMQKYKVDTE